MTCNKRPIGLLALAMMLAVPSLLAAASGDPETEYQRLRQKYPDYPIVSLLQKQEVTITPDQDGVPHLFVRETRVEMILSENGTDLSGGKEYFSGNDEIMKLEAFSLIPDKKKYRKLAVTDFKKTSEFDDALFFDDSYCYQFNYPAAARGVKRYLYSETELKNPYYPIVWMFAGSIPVEHAELTVTMPESVKINFRQFGLDTTAINFEKKRDGKLVVYRWTGSQSKVYDKDVLAPGIRYFKPHVILHIASADGPAGTKNYMGSLDDLTGWLDSKSGQVNQTIAPEIQTLADSITRDLADPMAKVRAIYKWVQNNIKYIAIEDGEHGWVPREAALVLQRRYGDCKDKSSLLTALLTASGEKASLVTVGTRELPYKYSEFPSISCANHMVGAWWHNGKPYILDGTSRNNKLEDVPASIQGKECVLRDENGRYLIYKIPVAPASANLQRDSIALLVSGNLLTGKGNSTLTGEIKTIRIYQLERKPKDKQQLLWSKAIYSASDKLALTELSVSDLTELNSPLQTQFGFELPDYLVRQGNQIFVNMNIERDLGLLKVEPDRVLPIEVEYAMEHVIVCRLQLPDNTRVSYLPEPVAFDHPQFGFSHRYELIGREVVFTSHVHIDTLLIEGADIGELRKMVEGLKKAYRQTVALTEEQPD